MKKFVVFLCGNCGRPMGARNSQKTSACPYCGKRNPIEYKKVKVLAEMDDAVTMKAAIQAAKLKRIKRSVGT